MAYFYTCRIINLHLYKFKTGPNLSKMVANLLFGTYLIFDTYKFHRFLIEGSSVSIQGLRVVFATLQYKTWKRAKMSAAHTFRANNCGLLGNYYSNEYLRSIGIWFVFGLQYSYSIFVAIITNCIQSLPLQSCPTASLPKLRARLRWKSWTARGEKRFAIFDRGPDDWMW